MLRQTGLPAPSCPLPPISPFQSSSCAPHSSRAFPWLRDHLVVSMVRDGNSTALINDPQVNPLAYSNGLRDPEDVAKPNVHPLVVSFMGFPVLLVVAMVDILPGQELLSRYGRRYWDRVREGLCAANSVARIVDV